MAQKSINSIFDAEAIPILGLYLIEGGVAGFSIPIYQRPYDWGENNINRLFEDVLSGLHWCSINPSSLTFLGTIIVLDENKKEETFDGRSLSVIDGQQRLTTISLLSCILYDTLERKEKEISQHKLKDNFSQWILRETQSTKLKLLHLINGKLSPDGVNSFPFPRIIRQQTDHRAKSFGESDYISGIAKFLFEFSHNYLTRENRPSEGFISVFDFPLTSEGRAISNNIAVIKNIVDAISADSDNDELEKFSFNLPSLNDFPRSGFKELFEKLPQDESEASKIMSYIKDHGEEVIGHLRLLAFSSFLINNVIVTLVKVNDEKYGFDIFDSLNSTGEPLTAIQTFKPQVIKFEDKKGRYKGSESAEVFKNIEIYINSFSDNGKKQKAAKELVVSFALYKTGEKKSLSLDEQRKYLRNNFDSITGKNETKFKRFFIKNLEEVSDYRMRFWSKNNLNNELSVYPERQLVLMCLEFLKDLNTSLSIPILCRYYVASQNENKYEIFTDAVKAVTAFIVIRRSVTSNTANIDSDLRALMLTGRMRKNFPSEPLHTGLKEEIKLIDVDTLKEYLKEWLEKKKIEVVDKSSWLERASTLPLYTISVPLCRFLLLAASHHSRAGKDDYWKLVKERPSHQTDYLNYDYWIGQEAITVEHIAPDTFPGNGWDPEIYSQPNLKHCLGNLTLLPQLENSSAANKPWNNKKILYQTFSAETSEELEKLIIDAKATGYNFSNRLLNLLRSNPQLPLASSIASVNSWDKKLIELRSKNLAELAWDEISPWLFS